MADRLSYGTVMAEAQRLAITAMWRPRPEVLINRWRAEEAAGAAAFLGATGRHLRFLAAGIPRNRIHDLAETIATIGAGIQEIPSGAQGPWLAATRTLLIAHDLLAAQVGPELGPRGPDGYLLSRSDEVTVAAGRVAELLLTVSQWARVTAGPGFRPMVPGYRPPTTSPTNALTRIATIASAARAAADHAGARRLSAIDDVTPLLGDTQAAPLDQSLERIRGLLYRLTAPSRPIPPRHHLHQGCANLAVVITGRLGELAHTAASTSNDDHSAALWWRLSQHARTTSDHWNTLGGRLSHMRSFGTAELLARRVLAEASSDYQHATRTPADATQHELGAALTAARRAALLLPDLAAFSEPAVARLARTGALVDAIGTRMDGPATAALSGVYREIEADCRTLVALCLTVPGPQPLAGRARALAFVDTRLDLGVAADPRPSPAPPDGPGL